MRSVFPRNFRIIFCLALAAAGCSSPGSRHAEGETRVESRTILNIRLSKSFGPILADGVSLRQPYAAAVNHLGELFISDGAANGIYRFSPDFEYVSSEGGIGAGEGSFNGPAGMACDQALNLYVAESGNRRVQILDRKLRRVRSIDSYFDESDKPVSFTSPQDIEIDREGNFWIADNDRVLKLDPFYELLLEMSFDAPGRFSIGLASSVDISGTDLVAVADPGNGQIIIATVHGNPVMTFPAGKPSCARWDNSGLLWVSDPSAGKIESFDKSGNLLFRHMETAPGFRPSWLAFDRTGKLIALDSGQRRIFVYEIIRGAG